jgi:hypothetical protein
MRKKLKEIPPNDHGGGLHHYLMIKLLQVDTVNVVRSLVNKLSNLNTGALEGENIMRACSLICWVHDCLMLVGKVPLDFQ